MLLKSTILNPTQPPRFWSKEIFKTKARLTFKRGEYFKCNPIVHNFWHDQWHTKPMCSYILYKNTCRSQILSAKKWIYQSPLQPKLFNCNWESFCWIGYLEAKASGIPPSSIECSWTQTVSNPLWTCTWGIQVFDYDCNY